METVIETFLTKKRTCALLTLLVLILNMFSPYGVLINNVNAASPVDDSQPYFELYLHPIDATGDYDDWDDDTTYYYYDYDPDTDTPETYTGTRIVTMDIIIKNGTTVTGLNAGNIKLKYDDSILSPIVEVNVGTNKKPKWELQVPDDMEDWSADGIYFDTSPATGIDTSACTFRIDGATTDTMKDETVIATLTFQLSEGKTLEDITKTAFTINDVDDIMLAYNGGADYFNGADYLLYSGFSAGEKQISEITIDTMPTKTQYYIGESLDYTDGKLKVKYDDSSEETISISEAITKGIITANQTVATNSKKVTFTYITKTLDLEYYVLDSISSTKNLNKMSYEHGDTIAFAGGEITAIYKNSSGASTTKILNIADEIAAGTLSVDKTKADVDNKTITFTYYDGKTATMTLTVTDPIESIVVTKQPTTLTYNDGDTINLAGGEITPHTKSGKTLTPIATDAATVTASTTAASIASATNKWTIAGGEGLEAGNQTITLTYEGKTADITIVVNDTVSGVSITTQPTAKNKYGTTASGLDFTGLVATITTSGGGNFTVGANSLSIDTSSYNPNSLGVQSLPVKYGTVASSNNAEITLTNYITGITATFTQTEFEYATPLATVVSAGIYVENYADGTISTPKAITSDMVTGYVASPATALLTNHKYDETLTIKLSTSSNPFDIIPATETQQITIIDVPESITIQSKPNKIVYKYAEEFSSNGGQIKVNYKSGDSQIVSMGASSVALTQTDGSTINMSPAVSELVDGKATKTIKVTYTNEGKTFDTSFDITIKDEIDSIAITTPAKTIYEHGDALDTSTGKITLTYKSGNTQEVSLDDATITEADGTNVEMSPNTAKYSNNELTKSLKVEYAGAQTNYDITIKNTVKSISVTAPTKVNYNLKDATELTGGKVVVTRKAGNTEDVLLTDTKVTVTDFDTNAAGVNKVANVKYTEDGKDYTGTFNYDVKDNVTGIVITVPTDVTFNHGDTLTFTGGDIEVSYAGGSKAHPSFNTATIIDTATGTSVNMSPASTEYDSNNEKQVTVKVTYSEDGVTKDATYTITIKNNVTKISMGTIPTKTKYNLNDTTYDLTNTAGKNGYGDIVVTRAAGNAETVALNDEKVTLTALNTLTTTAGTKTVTVTYEGNNTSFEITVENGITKAEITVPSKTTYEHGDTLDLAGGKIELTYADGTTKDVNLSTIMVSEDGGTVNMSPDSSKYVNNEITKTLTIEYTPAGWTSAVTKTYDITIKNTIDKIEVTAPTKVSYNLNDATELAGGKVVVTRKAGNTEDVLLTDTKVTVTDFDTTTAGVNKVANVKYTEDENDYTGTFNYTVIDNVTGIVITAPTDVTFNHGDALTFAGGSIVVSYAGGSTNTLPIDATMVVDKNTGIAVDMSPAAGDYTNYELTKTLTITYTEDGKTETKDYTITIKNNVTGIAMKTNPTKETYNLNDTALDLTGASIEVTRAVGDAQTISLPNSDVTTSGFDTSSVGTKTIIVAYEGNNTSFDITVVNGVKGITITAPTDVNFEHGDTLTLNGGVIEVEYADGTKLPVTMTTSMIKETETGLNVNMSPEASKYDSNNQLTKNLTIEYTEDGVTKTQDYTITITNPVDSIAIATSPKTSYKLNETTAGVGGTIKVTRKAGNTDTINIEDSMVTNLDTSLEAAGKTATVTYEGKTTTYTYDVTDNVDSIEIVGTPKTEYKLNEELETLQILVTKESGATETITVTSDMISGYDKTAEGTQTVKITYKGKDTSYSVNVKDAILSIAMGTTPKTNYLLGDSLDVTGGTITLTKESGAIQTINITPDMVSGFNSSSEVTGQVLTVTYEGKETQYTINVTDSISNITLNPGPTKTTYKYGESLDLTGVYIDIVKANGNTDRKQVTNSMVSGFNSKPAQGTLPNTQTITVTYGKDTSGNDVTTTFTITVEDYVEKITVNGAKTDYKYNEELDLSIGTLEITMASGTPATPIKLNNSNVTVEGYSKTTLNAQTLTVKYEGKETTYNVNVEDYITNTSIIVPTKTQYYYDDTLDLSTGKIVQTWASGKADTELPLDLTMVKEADGSEVNMKPSSFDSTNKVQKTLTITNDGKSENYTIEIINDVKSISIKEAPKADYECGDSMDNTVGSIEVTRANGTKEEIQLTDSRITIDGFDTSAPVNNVPVTIKFTENGVTKKTTYTINVNDDITSIQLVGTPKTNYKYGESLDLTGLTLTVVRPSGTTPLVPITSNMVSGYNPNKLGSQTVTITYGGKTETFTVNVEDYLKDIELEKPTKVNYKKGESLDLTGASITEIYASGAKKTGITVTSSMVSTLDTSTIGNKTLTVTYTKEGKNFTKEFVVIVADELSTITVKTFPIDEYLYGEELDLTGATLEVENESGDKQILPITKDMISGYITKPTSSKFEQSDEYIQVITITYTKDGVTKTTSYPITTKDYLNKIKVEGLEKDYTYGEDLKLDNATVAKVSASGVISDKVQLTKDMISGYNSKKEGNQELTISYAGKTTTQVVKVTDNILGISINSNPTKTTYNYNTAIDLSGAKLNVIKNSGIKVIDITKDMISGYNAKKAGVQTITVTYEGFTAEFTVTVKAQVYVKPSTPVINETKPIETIPEEPKVEEPIIEAPIVEEPTKQEPVEDIPQTEEKEIDPMLIGASIVAGLSILFLIAAILMKKNVEIYIEKDNDIKLIGKEKLQGKDNEELDLTKYVEKYPEEVLNIVFSKSISKKLDNNTVIIKTTNDKTKKITVKYNNEEFITEVKQEKLETKEKIEK